MAWFDHFYSSSVAIPISLIVLAAISLLSWRKKGHQVILALTLFLYARYLLWRGVYTLNTGDWASFLVSWTVYTAEAYAFVQILLFAYHAWSPLRTKTGSASPAPHRGRICDSGRRTSEHPSPHAGRVHQSGLPQGPLYGLCARRWSAGRAEGVSLLTGMQLHPPGRPAACESRKSQQCLARNDRRNHRHF